MAITTLAQLASKFPFQRDRWRKNTTGIPTGWPYYSPWLQAGEPGTGVIPSSGLSGDIPTTATPGSFIFVNPAAGENTYVAAIDYTTAQTGSATIALYDRLWHNSGIDRTLTTAQTINSVALTRPDATGDNAEAWWEVYVAMGTGTPTVTLGYTNDVGTAGRVGSSLALPASMPIGRTAPFTLQSGDHGVRSIQSWQGSATFGTVGTIGLVIRRLVAVAPMTFPGQQRVDAFSLGLPRVFDDACLEVIFPSSSTSASQGIFSIYFAQG